MDVTDFNEGRTYLVRQRGTPATESAPAVAAETLVIEVLKSVGMDSACVYQNGRFLDASNDQLREHRSFIRAVKRSSRRVFLIHPESIEKAVLLRD